MTRKLQFPLVILMILSGFSLSGQKNLKKANKQFDLRAYDLAITNYLRAIDEDPSNEEAIIMLAEAYRMINQPLEALRWYEKAAGRSKKFTPDIALNYAHTLKNLGLYERAKIWFLNYNTVDPLIGEHFALSCDFSIELLEEEDRYDISLAKYCSPESDFGVGFFKNKMVFASFRPGSDKDGIKKNVSYIQRQGNRLFIENSYKDAILPLRSEIKEMSGIGPLSYSKNSKMVAYTKNNFVNGYRQIYSDETDMSIFYAFTDQSGDFDRDVAFPFNSTEFSTAFPHLTFNGNAMYFSSNKPGGYGGFDLYVSYFKNGEWSEPENLGNEINSLGNEITPFFDGSVLFFASDHHPGLGGFDIFKSSVVGGKWTHADNLGKGVNSPADDYYPVRNIVTNDFYFSSNRIGGQGKDDIYVARERVPMEVAGTERDSDQSSFVAKTASLGENMVKSSESLFKKMNSEKPLASKVEETPAARNSVLKNEIVSKNSETLLAKENMRDERYLSTMTARDNALLPLAGAKRISIGEIIDTDSKAYFIQLAALSQSPGDMDKFRSISKLGNIYKSFQPNLVKIKLGYFMDRVEASKVLREVQRAGYFDAFITYEEMNSGTLELITSSLETNEYRAESFEFLSQSNYKVRLASYSDPLWFNAEIVEDLGKIEQWTKGSWTIFILSGFKNMEEAERARVRAVQIGFRDAELVIDNKGMLHRLKRN